MPFLSHYRQLSIGEIKLAQNVFGNSIDYKKVRIHCGRFIPIFQHPHIAMTPFGTIHFPRALYQSDFSQSNLTQQHLFIHEMVHVWQHQLGLPVWRHGLLLALQGGYLHRACYCYKDKKYKYFNQLNIEQQASFIADWFILQCRNDDMADLIFPFLNQPNDRSLLPKHSRFIRRVKP